MLTPQIVSLGQIPKLGHGTLEDLRNTKQTNRLTPPQPNTYWIASGGQILSTGRHRIKTLTNHSNLSYVHIKGGSSGATIDLHCRRLPPIIFAMWNRAWILTRLQSHR